MTLASAAAILLNTALAAVIHKVWDARDRRLGRGPGRWEPDSVTRVRQWRARNRKAIARLSDWTPPRR